MEQGLNGSEAAEDEMLDIEECFRPVAKTWGRSMFALVMNAGMAGEAMRVLAEVLERQHSSNGIHALKMLGGSFNGLSNAYVLSQGWTDEDVLACDRDIKTAFASRIVVPPSIILAH